MNDLKNRPQLNIFLYLLLFLGFMNFTGRGTYFLILYFLLFVLLYYKSFYMNITYVNVTGNLIFFFFCVSYFVSIVLFSELRDLMVPVCCFMAYLAGQLFSFNISDAKEIRRLFFVIISGLTAHGLLNFFMNVNNTEGFAERKVYDVWVGLQQATGHMSVFVPLIAASFVILFLNKLKSVRSLIYIACLLAAVFYSSLCATRYPFYLFFVVIIVDFIIYLFISKDKKRKRIVIWKFAGIILTVVVFIAFNLRTAIAGSNLYLRITSFSNDNAFSSVDRAKQISEVLSNFEMYLWGGDPNGYEFVHNSWVNALNFGGIFLFITFTVVTLRFIYLVFACRKRVDISTFMFLTGYLVCIMTYCWIESVLDSARTLFYSMTMILGVMEGLKGRDAKKFALNPNTVYSAVGEKNESTVGN